MMAAEKAAAIDAQEDAQGMKEKIRELCCLESMRPLCIHMGIRCRDKWPGKTTRCKRRETHIRPHDHSEAA